MATLANNANTPVRIAADAAALQVVVLGRSNSGKSTLIRTLSNASGPNDIQFEESESDLKDCDAAVLAIHAIGAESEAAEVVSFLRRLRIDRGQSLESSGLNVHVVLTHCDRIEGDDDQHRQARINERRGEIERQFREFADTHQSFGRLDVHIAATAIDESLGKSWGIDDLRSAIESSAEAYRARKQMSARRLGWTVLWTAIVIGGLIALIAALILSRTFFQRSELAIKIDGYRAREGQSPAQWLAEPLARKINELTEFHNDSGFAQLPEDLQQFVRQRLSELQAYRGFKDRIAQLKPPAQARTADDLVRTEQALKTVLTIPEPFRSDWQQTAAAQLREKWLDDIAAIRKAMSEIESHYRQLGLEAMRLASFTGAGGGASHLSWAQWQDGIGELRRSAASLPISRSQPLAGSRASTGQPPVTNSTPLGMASVEQERLRWESQQLALNRMIDASAALGLITEAGKPATLRLPQGFTADEAAKRLAELRQFYPNWKGSTLNSFSGDAHSDVRQAVQAARAHMAAAGRESLRRRFLEVFPQGKESCDRWLTIANWAAEAPQLSDLRELLNELARFSEHSAVDCIQELSEFLSRKQFEIELSSVQVTIPDELQNLRLQPRGPIVISVARNNDTKNFAFQPQGDGSPRQRQTARTFMFVAENPTKMTLHVGDAVWAELPLRDAQNKDWSLIWRDKGDRSPLYQFGQLNRTPVLKPADKNRETQPADGVSLSFVPPNSWPRVPDLLPSLK